MAMKIINIADIEGFKLGNAENKERGTGCTVIIAEEGAVGGVDVRGGGPATRETDLLKSENTVNAVNAVMISGGSAFGLEAASGVMRELADREIGFDVGGIHVPIVCGASLFDLAVGDHKAFPDVNMGIQAVRNAFEGVFANGNHGAGTGATVGKIMGHDRAMKSGLGTFACGDDYVQVGAIAAVNACGDIYNGAGNIIAGLRSEDGKTIYGTIKTLKNMVHDQSNTVDDNTSFINRSEIEAALAASKGSHYEESEEEASDLSTEDQPAAVEEEPVVTEEETVAAEEEPVVTEEETVVTEEETVAAEEEPVVTEEESFAGEEEYIPEPIVIELIPEEPVEADMETGSRNEQTVIQEATYDDLESLARAIEESLAENPVIDESAAINGYTLADLSEMTSPEPEAEPEPVIEQPELVQEPEPEAEPEPVIEQPELVQEPKPEAEPEPVIEPEPELVQEPEPEAEPEPIPEPEPEPEPIPEPEPEPEPQPRVLTREEMGYDITFNTTIGCLITNAALTKSQANKLASILHDAYARAIKPVHSTLDGDTIFVLTTGKQQVNFDAFAALATDVMQYAVIDGAMSAEAAYGLPAAKDMK